MNLPNICTHWLLGEEKRKGRSTTALPGQLVQDNLMVDCRQRVKLTVKPEGSTHHLHPCRLKSTTATGAPPSEAAATINTVTEPATESAETRRTSCRISSPLPSKAHKQCLNNNSGCCLYKLKLSLKPPLPNQLCSMNSDSFVFSLYSVLMCFRTPSFHIP